MPVDPLKTHDNGPAEDVWILRDPGMTYTYSEICELLNKAEQMGFSLDKGTELERLTARELDALLNRVQ